MRACRSAPDAQIDQCEATSNSGNEGANSPTKPQLSSRIRYACALLFLVSVFSASLKIVCDKETSGTKTIFKERKTDGSEDRPVVREGG